MDKEIGCDLRVQPIPIVTGYNGVFTTSGTGSTIVSRDDSDSVAPSLTKIAGRHTLKFGAEIRRLTHNYYQQNNPSGSFNFDSNMTTASPFAPSGGDGFASFLLGFGSGGGLTMNSFVAGQMIYRADALPLRWTFEPNGWSPEALRTGNWPQDPH